MTALLASSILLTQQVLPCHVIAQTAWKIVHATNIDDGKKVELITKMLGNGCIKQCDNYPSVVPALATEY